ncbi:glycoside hydrolase superfamily [Cerioporus squamosus]|nr:glycoside hydrolase superfamily [Cerioporus squamosus]
MAAVSVSILSFFALLVLCVAADPPRKSNGFTDVVTWDNYTVFLHDHRMFLHAGEFHTFRLPVPDLWLDIFQKMVAAGLNGVSFYIHMGATNPSPGVLDFDDWRSLQAIYEAAKLAGIFVVLRPVARRQALQALCANSEDTTTMSNALLLSPLTELPSDTALSSRVSDDLMDALQSGIGDEATKQPTGAVIESPVLSPKHLDWSSH